MGSKGCVVMSSEPVREYRDYLTKIHHDLTDLAWLYHMNNGVFMTPGQDEEWTLSVMHTDARLQRYLDVFETFAREVTGARMRSSPTQARRAGASITRSDARELRASELPPHRRLSKLLPRLSPIRK